MMIACGDFVIPGNKMPPNNAEAETAYAIFMDMLENGWLTVSSESLGDGKTRIRWELKKPSRLEEGQESLLGIHQTADSITFISTGTAQQGEERGIMLGKSYMHDWLKKELIHRGMMTDEIRDVFRRAKVV